MLSTIAKRIRHDEEILKTTSQGLLQTAGIMLISMLALLAVCAGILLLGRCGSVHGPVFATGPSKCAV
jgi:hypothetical protein